MLYFINIPEKITYTYRYIKKMIILPYSEVLEAETSKHIFHEGKMWQPALTEILRDYKKIQSSKYYFSLF